MSDQPRYALTGLNTYFIRTRDGWYVYDFANARTGGDRDWAAMFLWQPEHVAARVAELSATAPSLGVLRAERARP